MARVRSLLVRKLERELSRRFPPPAKVELQENDGIIGVITSLEFARMDTIDRQNLIGDLLATRLTADERRHVQVIVGVTPDEGTGYLAGED